MPDSPLPATPWGARIRLARQRRIPRLSIPAAARLARISPKTWGNIERGYEILTGGVRPARGRRETVAAMAATVGGITPKNLEQDGRPDAAEILTVMLADVKTGSSPLGDAYTPEEQETVRAFMDLIQTRAQKVQRAAGDG